jgi:hypothetical protein
LRKVRWGSFPTVSTPFLQCYAADQRAPLGGARGAGDSLARMTTDQSAAAKGRPGAQRAKQGSAAAAAQGGKAAAAKGEQPPAPPSARDALGGWLEGPNLHDGDVGAYRGERLGLPQSGPDSLAGQGRRLGALLVDWVIAVLIVKAIGWHPTSAGGQWGVLAVFAAEHLLLLSLRGYTIGKWVFRLRVGRLGGPLTPLSVVARTVLLMIVIPAVIWDRDGRGLHDRWAGTVELNR